MKNKFTNILLMSNPKSIIISYLIAAINVPTTNSIITINPLYNNVFPISSILEKGYINSALSSKLINMLYNILILNSVIFYLIAEVLFILSSKLIIENNIPLNSIKVLPLPFNLSKIYIKLFLNS